ncbi:MAG: hypothetical protein R3F60_28770 [bacterium]
MQISWASGVRVGALSVDPEGRVGVALWTHRVWRRPPARLTLGSAPLAALWEGVQGLPFGVGAVAAGLRLELLPTGYGPGGAAALLAEDGQRALVVGPTTATLTPRRVDDLVLAAPAPAAPPTDWLAQAEAAATAGSPLRLVAPDGAAAAAIAEALDAAGIPHARPGWLPGGRSGARVRVVGRGSGLAVDLRPGVDHAWRVQFARTCSAERVWVHGPTADALARRLTEAGLPARVIQAPAQLVLSGLAAHESRALPPSHGPVARAPEE